VLLRVWTGSVAAGPRREHRRRACARSRWR